MLSGVDVLNEGPVPPDFDLEQLRTVRAQFIASCGWVTFEEVEVQFSWRDQVRAESLDQDEVVLWFEHDLYDRLQLIRILNRLAPRELGRTKLILMTSPVRLANIVAVDSGESKCC